MMNFLIFGANGQVGKALMQAKMASSCSRIGLDYKAADITSVSDVDRAIRRYKPDVIINAAAYTDVDNAELASEQAFQVNAQGPAVLAEACNRRSITLFHLSSDGVFNGAMERPYRESDPISPINVYGKSKAEGEKLIRTNLERHIILRVSWVFSLHGTNFVKKILTLSNEVRSLNVINDQTGCPTSAEDIADVLLKLATRSKDQLPWGTYHFCGREPITWYEFAKKITDLRGSDANRPINIIPITTSSYGHLAPRAPYSVLDCQRAIDLLDLDIPTWKAALERLVTRWDYDN